MKIRISCSECDAEMLNNVERLVTEGFYQHITYESINDTGAYQVECPNGHITSLIVQDSKFEVLFEMGFFAIADGYYREAVSSFASALERFYEFYIKVTCAKKEVLLTEFEKTWKPLSKQSERQLGAFIICYFLENKTSPVLLHPKKVEFRNDVIHKGKIPNQAEAIDFGKAVSLVILPIIKQLLEKDYEIVKSLVLSEIMEKQKVHSHLNPTFGSSNPFLSQVLGDNPDERNFEKHLARVEKQAHYARAFSIS